MVNIRTKRKGEEEKTTEERLKKTGDRQTDRQTDRQRKRETATDRNSERT